MAFGSKCVAKNPGHDDLVKRIRKTLYFGDCLGAEAEVEENLSLPLASYASELFSKSHKGYSLNRLSAYNAGKIQANPCSLIMAVIFLERLNNIDPSYVRRLEPHELFIVSMMISTKFYVGLDEEVYLSDWAAEGNMTDDRLKQLELEFLCAIDWNIYISNQEFFKKLEDVEKILAARQGLTRNWLTYTELVRLLPPLEETALLLNAIFNHLTVLMVTYAAGILTIVGAFFLASNVPGHALNRCTEPSTNTLNGSLNQVSGNSQANLSDSTVATENSTCCALNAEAELLKLQQEYQQEEDRLRNSEIDQHALRLMVPVKLMSRSRDWVLSKKSEHKWLTFKEMYSDYTCNSSESNLCNGNGPINRSSLNFSNFEHFSNGTSALQLFWQILSDTAKPSMVRLPHVWFKFI